MDIRAAYKLLEVSEDISDDDLKKAYKALALKYHPDRYKEDETRFSKINEAYQAVQEYRSNPHTYSPFQGFNGGFNINIEDILGGFTNARSRKQASPNHSAINIDVNISFKEAIIGVLKEIEFDRFVKCDACNGQGLEFKSNGCTSCNGFGKIITNSNNMMFSQTCMKCFGRNIQNEKCPKCSAKGAIKSKVNTTINIPPGIVDNSILQIRGAGHYNGTSMFGETYTNVNVRIRVEKDDFLYLEDNNVICSINIALIEALKGCNKTVKTIDGNKEIIIPVLSKNNDEIKIKGLGVKNTDGAQIIKLNVLYPKDTQSLIEHLEISNAN
jgi:molecular chaperone DnaJ